MEQETRTCKKCSRNLPADHFEIYNKLHGWRRWECRQCVAARLKAWREGSKEHLREWKRQWHRDHRDEVIARVTEWVKNNPDKRRKNALSHYYRLQHEAILAYGGYRCACCGETEPMFLSFDHMNDDGSAHRKRLGTLGGARFYKWLRENGYPAGFQILCMNCNQGRFRNGGVCPHKSKA